jgi:hypothetical protein
MVRKGTNKRDYRQTKVLQGKQAKEWEMCQDQSVL